MIHNDIFDFKRFLLFLQRYLVLNSKSILLALAAISGTLIITSVLTSIGGNGIRQSSFENTSYFSLFLMGLVFASMCFSELHRPEKSIQFLTLPASRFEKVLAAWLSTTVIFIVTAMAFFYVAYFIASGLAFVLTNSSFVAINLFNDGFWKTVGAYWIVHSVFFLGAVYFRGYNFVKTVLSVFVIQFVLGLLMAIFGFIVFKDVIFGSCLSNFKWDQNQSEFFTDIALPALKITGSVILPIFLLIVSYIRFNEREA